MRLTIEVTRSYNAKSAPRQDSSVEKHLGQWIWLNIPAISNIEWHPFTIANACPETMVLQVQVNGDWTKKLFDVIY